MTRALIVEDDPVVGRLTAALLEEHTGTEAVVVAGGAEARMALSARRYDLVLCDIELPDADGLCLAGEIKEAHPELPVVVMTGHQDFAYAARAAQQRVDAFLVKPLTTEVVAATVERLLRHASHRPVSQAVVLAIGAHRADIELGVGGTLARHRAGGDEVSVLTLLPASDEPARSASAMPLIGVHALTPPALIGPLDDRQLTEAIRRAVQAVQPTVVYTHSEHDDNDAHRSVYRATVSATPEVRHLFGYESASSRSDFRPRRFSDVTAFMDTKRAAVRTLAPADGAADRFSDDLVLASARYWGRFVTGRHAEPLEIVRSLGELAA